MEDYSSKPCEVDKECRNSEVNCGIMLSKCYLCRFSPDNIGRDMVQYWSPTTKARSARIKHPQAESEKREEKTTRYFANLLKKRGRDGHKRTISRLAAKAEKKTEKNIIHATKNSGRQNKDGDHVSAGLITLDTKLQTTRDNPIILLGELNKVREDAKRAGKEIGGLVLRNKHGVGCVVLHEEDYAKLITIVTEINNDEHKMGS